MSTIGVLGDLHGNTAWARFAMKAFSALGVEKVIQVGDFGLYTDKRESQYLDVVSGAARRCDITLYVVPGNHENWDYINRTVGESKTWVPFRRNILVSPRVHRWEWEGVSFSALSGAPSVDRDWRVKSDARLAPNYPGDKSWYAGEVYTEADVKKLAALGKSKVFIGHDAPNGIAAITNAIAGNPHGFKQADLDYAASSRLLFDKAFDAVAPKVFFHGHYHIQVDETIKRNGRSTRVLGLNADTFKGSLATLNLETLEASHVPLDELLTMYRNGKL